MLVFRRENGQDVLTENHLEFVGYLNRLYELDRHRGWLSHDLTYENGRREPLSNWREYADQYFENHH